jgi:hypothetical protein
VRTQSDRATEPQSHTRTQPHGDPAVQDGPAVAARRRAHAAPGSGDAAAQVVHSVLQHCVLHPAQCCVTHTHTHTHTHLSPRGPCQCLSSRIRTAAKTLIESINRTSVGPAVLRHRPQYDEITAEQAPATNSLCPADERATLTPDCTRSIPGGPREGSQRFKSWGVLPRYPMLGGGGRRAAERRGSGDV